MQISLSYRRPFVMSFGNEFRQADIIQKVAKWRKWKDPRIHPFENGFLSTDRPAATVTSLTLDALRRSPKFIA